MRPNVYENKEEGIKCVYTNEKWLVSIKNWKPDNDIEGLKHLEIHHTTDEQFILVNGKAILITAERKDGKFETELTLMEKGKVYNVPKECIRSHRKIQRWFMFRIRDVLWKTVIFAIFQKKRSKKSKKKLVIYSPDIP